MAVITPRIWTMSGRMAVLPTSKKLCSPESIISTRSPSGVSCISTRSLINLKLGSASSSSRIFSAVLSIAAFAAATGGICVLPAIAPIDAPGIAPPPEVISNTPGSRKYDASWLRTCGLVLISHITRKNAIIAVTKSAYATFHAPP